MATINIHMKFEIEIPKQTWVMLRKPCRLQTDGRTDGRTDKVNPVYPHSNFVGRGYNNNMDPCSPEFIIRKTWIIRKHENVFKFSLYFLNIEIHYIDVIMTTMASQITSVTVLYSTVYLDADQRKHQSSTSLAFVWGIHQDWWILRTKGQLRGKCFHLMMSSCAIVVEICPCRNKDLFILCSQYLGCWWPGDNKGPREHQQPWYCRADSRFAPGQWEAALLCTDISHWLGANLESVLRADSRFAPGQWEGALLCNDISHWLGANLESVLRADSRFAPGQWEGALLCNDVSHWLGATLESALVLD